MSYYNKWIIQYDGNLKKALQGTGTRVDIINERYAIIIAHDRQLPYLKNLTQIEHMEQSKPIHELSTRIDPREIISMERKSRNLRGGRVNVACIGNHGITSEGEEILTNWKKRGFYTADAIRALRFIIRKTKSTPIPLVIYLPFDINKNTYRQKNLTQAVIEDMTLYTEATIVNSLEDLLDFLTIKPVKEGFRNINIAYELAPEDAIIDAFIIYNSFNLEKAVTLPPNTTLYPLDFPYSGVRGPVKEIKKILTEYLGKTATASLPFILGNQPINIVSGIFKTASILKNREPFKGRNTLVGIIDTGIDYTNPAFINLEGKTRIASIWDQTIGTSSPYGFGTVYDQEMINLALKSENPFEIVPHKDEWGHGTILAGIAAGLGKYANGTYDGVAPEAEVVVVKLQPASLTMQEIYYSQFNPLGFSALDIVLAIQFLVNLADQKQKPISICLPLGTNSGSHDGTNILDVIISSYASNPGVCVVLPVGEEANKQHHASGDLKEEGSQEVKLRIPKGQGGFMVEIWAMFGDHFEVLLKPPDVDGEVAQTILLNNPQKYSLTENSFIWSQGSKFDIDTGCQVIRFRLGNPLQGNWIIVIKAITIVGGRYHIWIPKTGMILPETVLSPGDPFTTIYNTSTATGVIGVGCYDEKALSVCNSSGRGFTRDRRVSPDFIVEGTDIPGPLPENKWGFITGSSPASAITAGICCLVYEKQIIQEEELSNTVTMKATLVEKVKREPTITYPNPSRGYGLLDINQYLFE